jgi:ubiquinone/menaquinone biosynthesis C-methylase UbiE
MAKITSQKVVEHYIRTHENDASDKVYPNLMLVRSFAFLQENGGRKVLDYGCGYGANTVFMLNRGANVYYADTSPYAIKKTSEKIDKLGIEDATYHSKVIEVDANSLPYGDDEFDVVVCTSVMSLLSSLEMMNALLYEFHRVLKTGGRIYIDINGIESEFAYYSKNLGNCQFEYCGRDGRSNPITAYCPLNVEDFSDFVETKFNVLKTGSSDHRLFDFREQEFIVIGEK